MLTVMSEKKRGRKPGSGKKTDTTVLSGRVDAKIVAAMDFLATLHRRTKADEVGVAVDLYLRRYKSALEKAGLWPAALEGYDEAPDFHLEGRSDTADT